jgi:hypothetical protein
VAENQTEIEALSKEDEPLFSGETPPTGPPAFEAEAVGRVAKRVSIKTIELVTAHFDREDGGPFDTGPLEEVTPEIGMWAEWALSAQRNRLGCLVNFTATFDGDDADDDESPAGPYYLLARFRVLYDVDDEDAELTEEDVQQFVQWNAVFNAWPYWREYLSSTINRAQLPRFLVPVMGVPRA